MEELIAKRYLKAIKQRATAQELEDMALIFSILAQAFQDKNSIKS